VCGQVLCAHPPVTSELEGGERSKAAHCSHTLVSVNALEQHLRSNEPPPHQHPARPRWGHPVSATAASPARRGGTSTHCTPAAPSPRPRSHPSLRPEAHTAQQPAASSTFVSSSSGSPALHADPLRRHVLCSLVPSRPENPSRGKPWGDREREHAQLVICQRGHHVDRQSGNICSHLPHTGKHRYAACPG
jgi:hypothetical protein